MTNDIIKVTDAAVKYIKNEIALGKKNNENYIGLRVNVVKGGCSGSEYKFVHASSVEDSDEVIKIEDVYILIHNNAVIKLIGSTLDYKEDIFSSGLFFINPNEAGSCGCGKSVNL